MATIGESPLPTIRRVVTGHSEDGRAIFLDDSQIASSPFSTESKSLIAGVYRTEEFPVENGGAFRDIVKDGFRGFTSDNGTSFFSFEMPPKSQSPVHRTLSFDFCIVMKGTATIELDDGARKTFKAGDIVIQRGCLQRWFNEGDEWNQVYTVLQPAKPVKINGEELPRRFE